ncbi:MAG: hypothetical protein IJ443_05045 [Firmicutes bacterium]|nr:hypothetical protein [Bacillota bacterium]
MHFHVILSANIKSVSPDTEMDEKVRGAIQAMEAESDKTCLHGRIKDMIFSRLSMQKSAFSRAVLEEANRLMEPFSCYSEAYFEFWDRTEEVMNGYKNDREDRIRLPEGTIVPLHDYRVRDRFEMRNGKVYELYAGQLYMPKRTHIAKKMKALPGYPLNKLASLEEYARNYYGAEYDEEKKAYGISHNPNAIFDWYEVGGRWEKAFLVKDCCTEFVRNDYSDPVSTEEDAPEGYMWVCAARKRDIDWKAMYDFYVGRAKRQYQEFEARFVHKKDPAVSIPGLAVWNNEVSVWGRICYVIGESEDSFLRRHGLNPSLEYYLSCCDLIDENGRTYDKYGCTGDEGDEADWDEYVQNYIRSLPEDAVLISADYND